MSKVVDKVKRYDSSADAQARLDGTVVRYDDIPVRLAYTGRGMLFFLTALRPQQQEKVPEHLSANSPLLNIESAPLGYLNDTRGKVGDVVYVSRIPARRFKQGLTPQGLKFTWDSAGNAAPSGRDGWPISMAALADAIDDKYPTVQEAFSAVVRDKAAGAAFHRRFAIAKSSDKDNLIRLRQCGETIGFVETDRPPTVVLLPEYRKYHFIRCTLTSLGITIE